MILSGRKERILDINQIIRKLASLYRGFEEVQGNLEVSGESQYIYIDPAIICSFLASLIDDAMRSVLKKIGKGEIERGEITIGTRRITVDNAGHILGYFNRQIHSSFFKELSNENDFVLRHVVLSFSGLMSAISLSRSFEGRDFTPEQYLSYCKRAMEQLEIFRYLIEMLSDEPSILSYAEQLLKTDVNQRIIAGRVLKDDSAFRKRLADAMKEYLRHLTGTAGMDRFKNTIAYFEERVRYNIQGLPDRLNTTSIDVRSDI